MSKPKAEIRIYFAAQLLRMVFETAGVVFIDENGGGPGVRLEKPVQSGD